MTDIETTLTVEVVAKDLEAFRYHFSDEVYVILDLHVWFEPDVNGVLAVSKLRGGGRKVLKDGKSLHKVYTNWIALWHWGEVPADLRNRIEDAAREMAEKVRAA